MIESKVISLEERAKDEAKSYLEELLSEGARKLLQAAIENEVAEYLEANRERRSDAGQRVIVRNGHHPERELVTGIGPIKVRQPRIRHRDGQKFSSAILPPYMRRVPSIDALIPALYLKGISTGDFTEALSAILGERASGLSATNVVRLKAGWEEEYKAWCKRSPSEHPWCGRVTLYPKPCSRTSSFFLGFVILRLNSCRRVHDIVVVNPGKTGLDLRQTRICAIHEHGANSPTIPVHIDLLDLDCFPSHQHGAARDTFPKAWPRSGASIHASRMRICWLPDAKIVIVSPSLTRITWPVGSATAAVTRRSTIHPRKPGRR